MSFLYIFISSFFLNLIWENLHASLYSHHLGQKITEMTLVIATLGDAVMLSILGVIFLKVSFFRNAIWLIIPIGLLLAIVIEKYALFVGRWSYGENMYMFPFLNVGLSPTLQLAATGYIISYYLLNKKEPSQIVTVSCMFFNLCLQKLKK